MKMVVGLLVAAGLVLGALGTVLGPAYLPAIRKNGSEFVEGLMPDKIREDAAKAELDRGRSHAVEAVKLSEVNLAKREDDSKLLGKTKEQIDLVNSKLIRAKEFLVSKNDGIDLVSLSADVRALTTRRAELNQLKTELESSITNAGKQHADLSDRARAVVLQLDGQESKLGKQIADRHVNKAEEALDTAAKISDRYATSFGSEAANTRRMLTDLRGSSILTNGDDRSVTRDGVLAQLNEVLASGAR